MTTRQYDFIVGPETSALPALGTPSDDTDLVTLGYANSHYLKGNAGTADLAALKAIAAADRADKQATYVKSLKAIYVFHSDSSDTADDYLVVQPTVGTGRWIRVTDLHGAINISNTTESTDKDTGALTVQGGVGIEKNLNVGGNAIITGDLTVNGTTTTLNTATLDVEDLNITINKGGNQTSADNAAGITVEMSDASDAQLLYDKDVASKWVAGDESSKAEVMTVSNAQTVTGKKFDDPLHAKQSTTPASPASGYNKVYPKSDNNWYSLNSAGVETPLGSGGGSGSGETNYVENPSGISDAAAAVPTGWANVGDLDVVVTKTAGDLPRENLTASGLKITADSNTQSTADYVYYDFTLDDVDLNKQLKIKWDQKVTGTYTAGQLEVIITTQADRTTAHATPTVTAIPASDTTFYAEFTTQSTATLSLVIRATGDMTTDGGIVISDVVVGPGTLVSGVAVQSGTYTPDITNQTNLDTDIDALAPTFSYQRVGTTVSVYGSFTADVVNAASAAYFDMSLPIATTLSNVNQVGGSLQSASNGIGMAVHYKSATTVRVYFTTSSAGTTNTVCSLFFSYKLTNASENVYLGSEAVEYASSDGSTVSKGMAGSLIPTTTPSGTFEYISLAGGFSDSQANSAHFLEMQIGGAGPWIPFGNSDAELLRYDGTNYIGANVETTGTTVRLLRGKYRSGVSSTWSGLTANTRWRVKKVSSPGLAGHKLASDTEVGLVKIPAKTSQVWLMGGNTSSAFGSVNTQRRRFETLQVNLGSDITYTNSSTAGAYFTINTSGLYAISYTDRPNSAANDFYIVKNYAGVSGLGDSDILAKGYAGVTVWCHISVVYYLNAGDYVSAVSDANGASWATSGGVGFKIVRIY